MTELSRLNSQGSLVHRAVLFREQSCTKKAPAKPGPFNRRECDGKSARIEFDDQMRLHLNRERHIRQMRNAEELRGHLAMIDVDVIRHVAFGELVGFENHGELLGGFL